MNFSFRLGTVDGIDTVNIFNDLIKFEPNSLALFDEDREPWDQGSLEKMAGVDAEDSIWAELERSGQWISAGPTGTDTPHNSIRFVQDADHGLPANAAVEKLIAREGFVSAYLFNADYAEVQSTEYSNNLKGLGLSLDSLRDTPYVINTFGNKQYDIRKNPGRKLMIGGSWLIAAWKMWFGRDFFSIVPKERLLAFPGAVDICELPGGVVYVQLFDDITRSDSPVNMAKQWEWVEWIDFLGLEKCYP